MLVAFTITPWMAYHAPAAVDVRQGARRSTRRRAGLPTRGLPRGRSGSSSTAAARGSARCSRRRSCALVGGAVALAPVGRGPAQDAPLRQQERAAARPRHARGDARSRRPTRARRATSSATSRPCPEVDRRHSLRRRRRARSTSTASCATTTCAQAPNLADVRVNLVPEEATARSRATRSRCGCATTSRRSRRRHGARAEDRRDAAGPAGPRDARRRGATAARRPRLRASSSTAARGGRAPPRRRAGRRRRRRHGRGDARRASTSCSTRRRPRSTASRPRTWSRTLRLALSRRRAVATRPRAGRAPAAPRSRCVLARAERSGAEELGRLPRRRARRGDLVPLAELGRFDERARGPADLPQGPASASSSSLGEAAGRPPAEAVLAMEQSLHGRARCPAA